jgi:hypothetical protein
VLLCNSAIYMAVMAILGGLHWAKGHSGQLAVAIMINIAITAQQLGGGAPTYTLMNEISSLRLRAKTQSFAITVNFVFNWAFNLFVPYIYTPDKGNLGAASALIFVGSTALCLVVAFFVIPETNGRSKQFPAPLARHTLTLSQLSSRWISSTRARYLSAGLDRRTLPLSKSCTLGNTMYQLKGSTRLYCNV